MSQGWIRLKPGVGTSIQISHMSSWNSSIWASICCLPGCSSTGFWNKKQNQNPNPGTPNLRCRHPEWNLYRWTKCRFQIHTWVNCMVCDLHLNKAVGRKIISKASVIITVPNALQRWRTVPFNTEMFNKQGYSNEVMANKGWVCAVPASLLCPGKVASRANLFYITGYRWQSRTSTRFKGSQPSGRWPLAKEGQQTLKALTEE